MDLINNSKVTAGVAMLLLNLGARYVQADMGKVHEMILSNSYVKKLIIFCLFFIATRDICVAAGLTVFYILVFDGILHEKRKFCIVPSKYINPEETPTLDIYQKYISNLSLLK